MYARQPERKDDFRSVHRPRVNYINYADEKLGRPDHTLTTDKKVRWVANAQGKGDAERASALRASPM